MSKRAETMCSTRTNSQSNEYLLLFNKVTGNTRVHYLLIDKSGRRSRILPKVSSMVMNKLKGIMGYNVCVLDNFLYIIGGRVMESGSYLKTCYRYDPSNNQWMTKASMLRGRARCTATSVGGAIFVCGGERRGGYITEYVERYDPESDTWTERKDMPEPRADHAACAVDGRLYITGGVSENGAGTSSLWYYDPVLNLWNEGCAESNLPRPRERHVMNSYKNILYCAGGMTVRRKNGEFVQTEEKNIMRFDCSESIRTSTMAGSWEVCTTHLEFPRCMATSCVLGHNIYIIGGHSYSYGEDLLKVEHYNTRKAKCLQEFSLDTSFTSVDSCIIRVPTSNWEFSHLGLAMANKWVLW